MQRVQVVRLHSVNAALSSVAAFGRRDLSLIDARQSLTRAHRRDFSHTATDLRLAVRGLCSPKLRATPVSSRVSNHRAADTRHG
jgi:hypothetical protein